MTQTENPTESAAEEPAAVGTTTAAAAVVERENKSWSPFRVLGRAFGTIWSEPKARFGVVLLLLFILMAIFAPLIAPYDPHDTSFPHSQDGSAAHLLGTTGVGQDVLSQLIWGARVSVTVALIAGLLSTIVAILVGLSWGYTRAFWGESVGFVVNLFLVIPSLPLMIVIAAYLHNGGIAVIVFVVVVTGWAWGARVLRSQTQTLRSRDFVTAAKFSGESPSRIVFREILPNMTSLIVASFFGAATGAILAEAGLEFLGLGDPNTVSWGTMLFWAQNSNVLLTGQWIQLFAPGFMIALFAVSMTFINFGVDGLSNPRLRERKAAR
ncbi:ABC transporter permease [Leifsonia sp. NPDC056665]|uniref:ABC transporter permease n=1 Tax=Leifsonia sp. NPDC056665 TaxID=3345901 RepID=UPI003694B9FC